MCECKNKKSYPGEFLTLYCTECGRIWADTMMGQLRPTDRYADVTVKLDGVWIGHIHVNDPSGQLQKHLGGVG